MNFRLLVALCLLSEAAAAADLQAIISVGGKDEAEVKKGLRRLRPGNEYESTSLWSIIEPSGDFPKVVQSDSIAGLKPGLFIAVIGFCTAEELTRPLAALKALEPQIYSKPVTGVEAACPKLRLDKADGKGAPADGKLKLLRAGPTQIFAVLDEGADVWFAPLPSHEKQYESGSKWYQGCSTSAPDAHTLVQECYSHKEPGQCHFIQRRKFAVTVEGGKIKATKTSDSMDDMGCQSGASHD
jgi:hypothetical protein